MILHPRPDAPDPNRGWDWRYMFLSTVGVTVTVLGMIGLWTTGPAALSVLFTGIAIVVWSEDRSKPLPTAVGELLRAVVERLRRGTDRPRQP